MKQKNCYFFFAGYYTVVAAAELLERYHIHCRVVKAPVRMYNSCRFAVLVAAADVEMAKYVFEREKVYISGMEYARDQ